ncbi:MAG: PAS domain-containing protein, partial [Candidatus Binatia bacterium]
MYDVAAAPGLAIRRGAYGTHPLVERHGSLQENADYIPADFFLKHLQLIADAVSERRQAQTHSCGNEERFRSLFDHSIDAVFIADPQGNIEAANPEACRLFGRTEEEISAIGRVGLVDPADRRLQLIVKEQEQSGRCKGELNFRRKDGSIFLGEISSAFYKDKYGAFKASVIVRDITGRKRVEETLRNITEGTARSAGDEFFRSLVKHLSNALQAHSCFVAECIDETKKRVRMLAFWVGEGFAENVEFPLAGTPCESVIQGNLCSYPERLQVLFPEDKGLVGLGACPGNRAVRKWNWI